MDAKTVNRRVKSRCKRVWDMLALEYYSELHKTSRNFDRIIGHNVPKIFPKLSLGLYLDLGGGRGRLEEMYSDRNVRIIVGDLSKSMLKTRQGQFRTNPRIQMDAFNMPFKANTFEGVFSFIGDSYALREAFQEVLRVLKPFGFFLVALPTKIWRQNLTSFLRIRENETVFTTGDGKQVKVPSFLYSSNDLEGVLLASGFREVAVGEWNPDKVIRKKDLSEHVKIAARNLSMPLEELPLITYAVAVKSSQSAESQPSDSAKLDV